MVGVARPHAAAVAEVVAGLSTDVDAGLATDAVRERLDRHGRNALPQPSRDPWWRRLVRQFSDLLIWILIGAVLVSGVLGQWLDAGAILAIVVLNGVLGFVQEGRAEQALATLQRLSSPRAKALRDGQSRSVPTAELVPGDVVDLEAGDLVPADLRLVRVARLRVEEAALTGESVPEDKDHRPALDEETPLGDRVNMAYLGTTVTAGTARGVVVATGKHTELGQIAGLLQRQEVEPTPLQRKLAELGRVLLFVVLGIVTVMFGLQLLRGGELVDGAGRGVPRQQTVLLTLRLGARR